MSKELSLWRYIPIINFIVSEWQVWCAEQTTPRYLLTQMPSDGANLPPYPIDMWPLLAVPHGVLDEAGLPYNAATKRFPASYHPTTIAQFGLVNWNTYLATREEKYREAFMTQALWLVDHEIRLTNGAGAWPMPFSEPLFYAQTPWLSALTQGNGISVLVRAYHLTKEDIFFEVAKRAIHTFELDIRDGGVSTTIGNDGIFFEEAAAYPVAHILNGYIFSLFGLYDYVALTNDMHIKAIVERSVATLHRLIDKFDMHYWSYYDLLHKNPASHFYHDQHCILLKALASYSGCDHCVALSQKWEGYMYNPITYTCYFIASRIARYRRGVQRLIRNLTKPKILYTSENPVLSLLAKPSEVP